MTPLSDVPRRNAALCAVCMLVLATLACGAGSKAPVVPAAGAAPAGPTRTPTQRVIPTLVPTFTRVPTYTPSATPTATSTPTRTPTHTVTPTRTRTPSPTPTWSISVEGVTIDAGGRVRYIPSTPTPDIPCPSPKERTELRGKILFLTDREWPTPTSPKDVPSEDDAAIYVMDSDGANAKPLGPAPKCARQTYDYFEERKSFTGDSAFRVLVEKGGSGTSLYIRDARGALVRRITTLDGMNYDPAWSPSNERVAFVSQIDMNDEIYTVNITTMQTQRMTFNTWEWDKHPAWSPDGKLLAFWSNRQVMRKQIWVMSASDGGQPRNLSNNEFNDWNPVWVNP